MFSFIVRFDLQLLLRPWPCFLYRNRLYQIHRYRYFLLGRVDQNFNLRLSSYLKSYLVRYERQEFLQNFGQVGSMLETKDDGANGDGDLLDAGIPVHRKLGCDYSMKIDLKVKAKKTAKPEIR